MIVFMLCLNCIVCVYPFQNAKIYVIVIVSVSCYMSVNVFSVKRQMADVKASEYLALIRLGLARGCRRIACGLINIHARYNKMYVLSRFGWNVRLYHNICMLCKIYLIQTYMIVLK